jgi:hypothetical protein
MAVPFVALVFLLMAVGCSADAPTAPDSSDVFSFTIQRAEEAGADESQLEILRNAQDARVLEFSDYLEAENNAVACIVAAGIDVQISDVQTVRGAQVRSFTFQESPDYTESQLLALVDDCETRFRVFVLDLQVNQPQSVENFATLIEGDRHAIEACLQELGADDEVGSMSALELFDASLSAMSLAFENGETARDCVAESGIAY